MCLIGLFSGLRGLVSGFSEILVLRWPKTSRMLWTPWSADHRTERAYFSPESVELRLPRAGIRSQRAEWRLQTAKRGYMCG